MKQLLLCLVFLVAGMQLAFSQCNELFFSEYVEGTFNNKALELYNPTSAPINLLGYQLVRYSNGGTTPYAVEIWGTIQPYSTFVTVLDKTDTAGTGQEAPVWPDLLAKADTLLCPVYNVNRMHYFNGNDAVTLERLDGTYLDIIGKIGENPGNGWTCDTAAGFTDALGGRWMTKDKSLIRRASVKGGVTANPLFFNACAEWDSLSVNTFTHLGWHECECDPTFGITPYNPPHNGFVYPNPVRGSEPFLVKGTRIIEKVTLYNSAGQQIATLRNPDQRGDMTVTLPFSLQPGLMLVQITFDDERSTVLKVIIR